MPDLMHNITDGHARGWSFTPLLGKAPIWRGWQSAPRENLYDALMWGRHNNIGLRTGQASGGIIVIDVDPAGDIEPLGLPPTVTVATGRPGGRHYYFRHDGDVGNSAGKLGEHIDTRGNGGQVVFPGSVHPETGVMYDWVNGFEPWAIEVAELPDHIADMLEPRMVVDGPRRPSKHAPCRTLEVSFRFPLLAGVTDRG